LKKGLLFLKKKKQKNFCKFGFGLSGEAQQRFKSFLVLFFKKERLSSYFPQ